MKKKILLVDDELEIIALLKKRLMHMGYEVVEALDGLEALNAVRREHPDLIVLDVMMPKLNGFKVCRMLKFDENYQAIPIVILSARHEEADIQTGREQRADAYFTKPYNPSKFFGTIEELLVDRGPSMVPVS